MGCISFRPFRRRAGLASVFVVAFCAGCGTASSSRAPGAPAPAAAPAPPDGAGLPVDARGVSFGDDRQDFAALAVVGGRPILFSQRGLFAIRLQRAARGFVRASAASAGGRRSAAAVAIVAGAARG